MRLRLAGLVWQLRFWWVNRHRSVAHLGRVDLHEHNRARQVNEAIFQARADLLHFRAYPVGRQAVSRRRLPS